MASTNKSSNGMMEWRINLPDGTMAELAPKSSNRVHVKMWMKLKGFIVERFLLKIWRFLKNAWSLGVAEPQKVVHGVKVGLALSIVSLLYYLRPLYDGVGSNALWAVMTVVVVFEYTVGATICKCTNRAVATIFAGGLGLGVHWIADHSGEFKPIILSISVFIFGAGATFSRFIPSIKARFDYGAVVFILTFSLVSVSGFRVEKLIELAEERFLTIAIGVALCLTVCLIVSPVWGGQELHSLIISNMDKLAQSLHGCVAEYFTEEGEGKKSNKDEDFTKKIQSYKCVLNSKASEESMANFASWEVAHWRFSFRHPWKQYLKIGASMRSCAYCIETLNTCISSDIQPPSSIKNRLSPLCSKLGSTAADILKELSVSIKTMTKSSKIDHLVSEMTFKIQELHSSLKSIPADQILDDKASLMEVLPLVTAVTVLVEIGTRVESIAEAVEELANMAEFKSPTNEKLVKENLERTNLTTTSKN